MSAFAALLAWHRAPRTAGSPWHVPLASLPPDMGHVLRVAAGHEAAVAAARAGLDVDGDELQAAALHFIRDVLLAPGSSYYRKLGVEPDASAKRIRAHYRELISIFHPDRESADRGLTDADLAAQINEAYNALKQPERRSRHDRLQAAASTPTNAARAADATPMASRGSLLSARHGHPCAAPRWRADVRPGALRVWLAARSPGTLKAIALLVMSIPAVLAVLLMGGREPPTLAAMPAQGVLQAGPLNDARSALAREVPLAALLEHGSQARAKPARPVVAKPASAHDRVPVAVVPARAEMGPVATWTPTPALPSVTEPIAQDHGATLTSVPVQVEVPLLRAADVATVTAPAAAPPSTAEIDALIEHFLLAYEAGDLAALLALIDPEAAQEDRIAFTLANFTRVFRETSSRRIEIEGIQRTSDRDRARVRLAVRTHVSDEHAETRAQAGELTLVARKRGEASMITDVRYRPTARHEP